MKTQILTFSLLILLSSCAGKSDKKEKKSSKEVVSPAMQINGNKENYQLMAVPVHSENIFDATKEMEQISSTYTYTTANANFDNSYEFRNETDEEISELDTQTFLFESKESKENEFRSVKWNISENCNRISEKSWRCCGNIIIYWDGTMTSQIHTSSNRLQGFTGAIKITFYDGQQRAIYEVHTPSYGVNAESSRWDSWSARLDDWVLNTAQYASAEGIHKSSNRTLYYIYDLGKQYLKSQGGSSGGFEF